MLLAQRGGIDPGAIATALPLEGAPLAVPGPYKIESGPAFNSPGHLVYRPSDLTPFPSKDTLPLIVWGNGGCSINSNRYAGFLTTIASHGFVVMATAAQPGVNRATADHLRAAIAWAEAENTRAGSPLMARSRSTVSPSWASRAAASCRSTRRRSARGHHRRLQLRRARRCGWYRREAARPGTADQRPRARLPDGVVRGHFQRDPESARVLRRAEERRPPATVDHPGGGEWANVASSWARWQLKGNKEAGKMFAGKDCELCTNANWVTKSKVSSSIC